LLVISKEGNGGESILSREIFTKRYSDNQFITTFLLYTSQKEYIDMLGENICFLKPLNKTKNYKIRQKAGSLIL